MRRDLLAVSVLAGSANQPSTFLPAPRTFRLRSPVAGIPARTPRVDSSEGSSARQGVVQSQVDGAQGQRRECGLGAKSPSTSPKTGKGEAFPESALTRAE